MIRVGLARLADRVPPELRGARAALVAHPASVAVVGGRTRHAVDLLAEHPTLELVRLFGPEHGLYGGAQAGEHVADGRDPATGLEIVSLYGARRAPEPAQVQDIDALLFDLQDVGVRCFTYLSTLKACLELCADTGTRLVVLERPNPLGRGVYGPGVAPGFASFVSAYDVPFVHGRTLAELALEMARALGLEPPLLIRAEGWGGEPWNETGLEWLPPSPNLPTLASARAYPVTVFVEGTTLSEGRGTPRPFEQVGGPGIGGAALADTLNALELPVRFSPVRFTPERSKHAGTEVEGVRLVLPSEPFDPLPVARALLAALRRQGPLGWLHVPDGRAFTDLLYGSSALREGAEAAIF